MKSVDRTAKYRDVFQTLRLEILAGRHADHEKFPSEQMLARRFGVSRPTITRALQELKQSGLLEGRVGSGTYLGNVARTAAGYIGMIIPDRDWNLFFAAIANGFETAARLSGYTVLKDNCTQKDPELRTCEMEALAREFAQMRVRGVLFEPYDARELSEAATGRILSELEQAGIPVVLVDRDVSVDFNRSQYDLVQSDNVRAGYMLARHLIEQGAKRLAFLTLPQSGSATLERILGFSLAVREAGLKWSERSVLTCDDADFPRLRRLFARRDRPDAIGCRNDHVAAFLLQGLATINLRVPQDLLVGGFDDCRLAELLSPPLTSVRQPAAEIAEAAFRMLLDRIAHPDAARRRVLLDVSLSVRGSTRRRTG